MALQIEPSLIEELQTDVHARFLAMGSKIRKLVTVLDAADVSLDDFETVTWADEVDLSANSSQRQALSHALAYELGQSVDEVIVDLLGHSNNYAWEGVASLTDEAAITDAIAMLNRAGMPDDGQRVGLVGWKQWSELTSIPGFWHAPYVPVEELIWPNSTAKKWKGVYWMPFAGLTLNARTRFCYLFHRSAIGHAIAPTLTATIKWLEDRRSHLITCGSRQGGGLLDRGGVVSLRCGE